MLSLHSKQRLNVQFLRMRDATTEIGKTANAFLEGNSVPRGFPRGHVSFIEEDKRWTLGGLWIFLFLIFRRIWKVSRRLRRHLPLAESWPRPSRFVVLFSSHQKMFITRSLRHPRGELLRPDTTLLWDPKIINSATSLSGQLCSEKLHYAVLSHQATPRVASLT